MKIDLFVPPIDKDVPARGSGGSEADRGAMGDAFGKAVRDAGEKRPTATGEKSEKTEVKPKPEEAAKGGFSKDAAADASVETKAEEQPVAEKDPLQTLLGALAALKPQGADEGETGKGDAKKAATQDGLAVAEDTGLALKVADPIAPKEKGGMKLDVLRMETHFEPRQDGMVLVQATDETKPAPVKTGAEAKAKVGANANEALPSALLDVTKTKPADAKAVSDDATTKDAGLPAMRFDEALARLGQGAGGRSGGDTNRNGSAAAQSALAELAGRRAEARSADVGVSAAVDLPSSASQFNLAGQVAGPILDALGDPGQASSSAPAPSTDAHLRMRAGGGALKTLTIQLHPEHLGTVDVSLRLNEGRLTLELAASRSDTASMLLDDQASLRKLLEHAGFSLDDAAISVITRDNGQIRTADTNASGAPQRDASGSGGGDGRQEARGQSSGSDEQSGRRRPPARASEDAVPAKGRSGSTYL